MILAAAASRTARTVLLIGLVGCLTGCLPNQSGRRFIDVVRPPPPAEPEQSSLTHEPMPTAGCSSVYPLTAQPNAGWDFDASQRAARNRGCI